MMIFKVIFAIVRYGQFYEFCWYLKKLSHWSFSKKFWRGVLYHLQQIIWLQCRSTSRSRSITVPFSQRENEFCGFSHVDRDLWSANNSSSITDVLQGSAVTNLRCGRNLSNLPYYKFTIESAREIVLKMVNI